MRYIKTKKEYIRYINDYISRFKLKFNDFIENVKKESDETKEAFDLLLKDSRGELLDNNGLRRELTINEREIVRTQAIDILKLIGLTSLTVLPGGVLIFIILKVFKLKRHILPSSFKRDK